MPEFLWWFETLLCRIGRHRHDERVEYFEMQWSGLEYSHTTQYCEACGIVFNTSDEPS
ncbi:hypothetical protein SEA_CHEESETOUCH_52 [Gordonia phage CheeseTouch]